MSKFLLSESLGTQRFRYLVIAIFTFKWVYIDDKKLDIMAWLAKATVSQPMLKIFLGLIP